MAIKHPKTMRVLSVFTLIVFLFVFCISSTVMASASSSSDDFTPYITTEGNFKIAHFYGDYILKFVLPQSITVDPDTKYVTVEKPLDILNSDGEKLDPFITLGGAMGVTNRTVVFNNRGNYLPAVSGVRVPEYDARYDTLTYKYTELNPSIVGDGSLDFVMYATTDVVDGTEFSTNDYYVYSINTADIEYLTYEGKPYVHVSWKPFQNLPDWALKTDKALMSYEFRLRFKDISKLILSGFDTARYLKLGFNSYVTDCTLSNYSLSFVGQEEVFELYYKDSVSITDIYDDVFLSEDCNFPFDSLGYFRIRYDVAYAPDDLNNTNLEAVFNIYLDSLLGLESPTLSNSINSSVIYERGKLHIEFEQSALDHFKDKISIGTNPTIDDVNVDSLSSLDMSSFSSLIQWGSQPMKFALYLSGIALTIAFIGFALTGKKG